MATSGVSACEWVSLRSALAHFVTFRGSTQSQRHIKPLRFFGSLYRQYDERFVYAAPDLKRLTARREWDPASAAFSAPMMADLDYEARMSS